MAGLLKQSGDDLRQVAADPSVDQFVVLDSLLNIAAAADDAAEELRDLADQDTEAGDTAEELLAQLKGLRTLSNGALRRMSGADRSGGRSGPDFSLG